MSRLDRPETLGPHLEENARVLEEILDGTDASPMLVFGRVEALARSWAAVHRDVLAPYGLHYSELTTLGMLRTAPDAAGSPAELRALVGQTSAGMTRILDKLEAQRLVRRVAHPEDGRRIDVRLTARGARLAEACLDALLRVENELLAGLGKRRRDTLVGSLDALLRAFASRSAKPTDDD